MVDLIPKKQPKIPSWINISFYVSISLLIIIILSIIILSQLQKRAIDTTQKLSEELKVVKSQERKDLEKKIINSQQKIANFSYLIDNHKLNSKTFYFLEKTVHPKVQFTSFNLSSKDKKLVLQGETENFFTLGQQFLIFKAEPLIKSINLTTVSITKDGRVGFTFEILFLEEFFK